MPSIHDWLASEMASVDAELSRRLTSEVPLVSSVTHHIVQSGGKRLRPKLLLLCCGALGITLNERYSLAAIIECIHTATLLHDDVVDESHLRRGQTTANACFGNPASVLVGDFLYSRAFQMMVEIGNPKVLAILAEATNVIAEGEVLQLMHLNDADLDEATYLAVIESKTAKLFEASTQLAAVLGNATSEIEAALAAYGKHLGTAFQIIDDVLDYAGNRESLGKQLGDDLREGKATLPLIAALTRANTQEAAHLKAAIQNGNTEDLNHIIDILEHTGGIEVARNAAHTHARLAIEKLGVLAETPHKAALLELASDLLGRET